MVRPRKSSCHEWLSSAEPILKQSRRELPSTDPPTRAPDEALQISWAGTALSRGARHPQCSFPPQTTFTFCRELSSRKAASIRDMAGDHRSLTSAWNTTPARRAAALSKPFKPIQRLSHRNVTVPGFGIPFFAGQLAGSRIHLLKHQPPTNVHAKTIQPHLFVQ